MSTPKHRTPNTFALLLLYSGLTQQEAAAQLGVSPSSIDKMARGERNAPPGVITDFRDLIARIEDESDDAVQKIRDTIDRNIAARGEPLEDIVIGYPVDDSEAHDMGFPSVNVWRAVMARVVVDLSDYQLTFAARGTTSDLAVAEEIHTVSYKRTE